MNIIKSKIFQVLTIISVFILIALFNINNDISRYSDIISDYKLLTKEDSMNGVVIFKFDYMKNKFRNPVYNSLLKVNHQKISVFGSEINTNEGFGINQIVSVGDSIIKNRNSDTIIIIKPNKRKFTLLRRDKLH